MEKHQVRLLTLNAWGLKYISKHRKARLRWIANQLAVTDYDIVALQEVWVEEDWLYIDEKCRAQYPYRRLFRSGIIAGPGLAILSKIPINNSFLYRFPINGRPSAFFRGDWLVGKSIAVTILEPITPQTPPIALLNSHMHAPYASSGDAAYSTHRACQAWDMAKLVKTLKKANYAVIQVGDLNSKPNSLPYKLFTMEGGLADSWEILQGENNPSPQEIACMSPQDQILKAGVTCNSVFNTWHPNRQPHEACRLDYVLIDSQTLTPVSAAVRFTELLPPPISCSASDHFAFEVNLVVSQRDRTNHHDDHGSAELRKLYEDAHDEITEYLSKTIPFQATWRKYHFLTSILLVIAIHIGMTFAAQKQAWSSILLSLTSTLIAVTGVLNGLIWGFGVRSESRALQEVRMEVEDAMRGIERLQASKE
ncbi:hypothetical protein CJI97_004322 [Candidozyma auris]|nr:hypothetical protein CJI97_004322 [[Candida] auris]